MSTIGARRGSTTNVEHIATTPSAPNGSKYLMPNLHLAEFLQCFTGPTFVIDLAATSEYVSGPLPLSFTNAAFHASEDVCLAFSDQYRPEAFQYTVNTFFDWALRRADEDELLTIHVFAGFRWKTTTLRARWRVVTAWERIKSQELTPTEVAPPKTDYIGGPQTLQRTSSSPPGSPLQRSFSNVDEEYDLMHDWTRSDRFPLPANMSEHTKFLRARDWSKTSLGPMHAWSKGLRRAVNFLLNDPRPAALMWGPDRIMLYNEKYVEIVGKRHPERFGWPFRDVFPEVLNFLEYFKEIEVTHKSISQEDSEFHLTRNGFVEETYFSFSLIPIFEKTRLTGIYNPVFDVTRRRVAERRMSTLIKAGELIATCSSIAQFWQQAVLALKLNQLEIPFAAVYSVHLNEDMSDNISIESNGSKASSMAFVKRCAFEGSTGIPDGHPAIMESVDLTYSNEGFIPYFRKAATRGKPLALLIDDGSLPAELLQGITCAPFGDVCRGIVICPVKPTTGAENIGGFLVLGLNPRRPYDEDYQVFMQLLIRLFATSMASTTLLEAEVRRGMTAAEQAAMDQAKLEEELAAKVEQAERLEMQFTHFADSAPIGINMFDVEGKLLYANDVWFDVTQCPRQGMQPMEWMNAFHMEEVENAEGIWKTLLEDKKGVTFESRLKRPWLPPGGTDEELINYTWVLASAYPELNAAGDVECIVGCFCEISQQKWAEGLQKRRIDDLLEAKRLQESFIDMTSHEMRNPLSAIIHCADSIIGTLEQDGKAVVSANADPEAVSTALDAAKTILHCSQHQKRIVDDVLVLSKLNSDLLPVTPIPMDVLKTVKETASMFDAEMKATDITFHFHTETSLRELGIDWVFLDPSRLTQVLINLLTNAIKFTQLEPKREISIRVGATLAKPTSGKIKYVRSQNDVSKDLFVGPDWEGKETVYLQFAVEDTGRGLTESETDLLFRRFSQSSPKTHTVYGGSGLGLYISRELTEKQNGEIGVFSESGKGSIFAFYLKSKRAERPVESVATLSTKRETVALPRAQDSVVHIAPLPTPTSDAAPPAAKISKPETPSPGRFTVLVVEDNLVNRKVLSKQLRKLGYVVEEANHGEEALAHLQETKFWAGNEIGGKDLAMVLMDWEMPIMDGITATQTIRDLQRAGTITRHVPTIGVTANARKEQIERAIEAGMDRVVNKPFRVPQLVEQMDALLAELGV